MADENKTTATPKEAQRQISLEDIKFNQENAVMAAVACIPLVGIILFFVEKKDLFVRYHAAQFGILFLLGLLSPIVGVLALIPIVGLFVGCIAFLLGIAAFFAVVIGVLKAYKGERFDIPVISDLALKLMNNVQI